MIKVTGFEAMAAKLTGLSNVTPELAASALFEETLIEEKESRRRTPVLTGALRGSHVSDPPKFSGRDISTAIRVGGPAAPYAIPVHENLDADHKVGQAKFLESTIMESKPFLVGRIARRIQLKQGLL